MNKVKVGIIGCGNISGIYFTAGRVFDILEITACADLIPDRAKAKAEEFGCSAASVEQLLADPEIEIVMNLTVPKAHAEVAFKVIEAGKSVYNEKPLSITREDGEKMLEMAKAGGVRVGCAPDTFMGGGIQTCIKLLDDGWIGEPVAATAFMMCHGHEHWHPNVEFYYKPGGGPVFDMGPYYLTALISLLGPIKRIASSTRITFRQRVATCKELYGKVIDVEVPTHVAGLMDFANGASAVMIQTFDVWGAELPPIEIYGTEGSMSVPDPNTFEGPVRVKRSTGDWMEVPLTHGYTGNSRGIGVADMAYGLRSGREHRPNGELAYHVLDAMSALNEASDLGKYVTLRSTCKRPKPLPLGLRTGMLD